MMLRLIVVDDGSTDDTFEIASRYNVRLLKLPRNMGPSAARNSGAEMARAPVLFFIDADVAIAPGAIARAKAAMSARDADAIIGSYDDDPAAKSTISRFKNLAHHYFHQRSRRDATTFWGACGLVRRESFFAAGAFDEQAIRDRRRRARLQDDSSRRSDRSGSRTASEAFEAMDSGSLVATDVWRRAIPWTLLRLEGRRLPADLNFSIDQRIAAVVAVALAILIPAAIFRFQLGILVATLIAAAIWLNLDLYRLLFRKGGLRLSINGFLLQQFYYLYSVFGVVTGTAIYLARSITSWNSARAIRRR